MRKLRKNDVVRIVDAGIIHRAFNGMETHVLTRSVYHPDCMIVAVGPCLLVHEDGLDLVTGRAADDYWLAHEPA